jgi:osmotically-inducible protein OsmY
MAALLALPAAAHAQKGSSDAQVQQAVQDQMSKKKQWQNVKVAVSDRVATLTGTTETYADKARAERKAGHISGVSSVVNKIEVSAGNVSDDQLFETIADKLRYDRVDQGIIMGAGRNVTAGNTFNSFNVDVKNGVVTLSGNARTASDAASAVAIVENTPGVKDVIDNIEIAPASIMDDQLRIRVARAIYGDPVLSKYAMDPQQPIRIIVQNGKVMLEGQVLNEGDKDIAGIRANTVSGVFAVQNNLAVANQQQPR